MIYHRKDYRLGLPERRRRGRLIFWSMLLVVGVPLLLVSAAEAQNRAAIERELEKTDAVIERAKEAVSASRNLKAENLLQMAVELQGRGREAGRQLRYRLALDLTLKAREKAYEAIGFTKRGEENENLVLKAIERTDRIIDRAREAAGDLDQRRASSLLDMAVNNQQRAREFFAEHRLKMALKLTAEARQMAQKILRLAGNGGRMDRLAQRELDATERFLDKAAVILQESPNQTAVELLEKAGGFLAKAKDALDQNAFDRSIKNSQKAAEMVEKALRLVEEDIAPSAVEVAIEQNQSVIERGEEVMKGSVSREAVDLFQKGLSHQSKAREYYGEGEYRAALAEAKVANRLLTKALQMVEEGGP
jgi:HEPN domain-containing protein